MEAWARLKTLGPTEPLPQDMPHQLYFRLYCLLQCGKYAELLEPYLKLFGPEK